MVDKVEQPWPFGVFGVVQHLESRSMVTAWNCLLADDDDDGPLVHHIGSLGTTSKSHLALTETAREILFDLKLLFGHLDLLYFESRQQWRRPSLHLLVHCSVPKPARVELASVE